MFFTKKKEKALTDQIAELNKEVHRLREQVYIHYCVSEQEQNCEPFNPPVIQCNEVLKTITVKQLLEALIKHLGLYIGIDQFLPINGDIPMLHKKGESKVSEIRKV